MAPTILDFGKRAGTRRQQVVATPPGPRGLGAPALHGLLHYCVAGGACPNQPSFGSHREILGNDPKRWQAIEARFSSSTRVRSGDAARIPWTQRTSFSRTDARRVLQWMPTALVVLL